MRHVARGLLWLFAFTVPWEYSLVFDAPFGNIARVAGVALFAATAIAVISSGRMRAPGPMQWAAAALLLWYCCTCFWSADAVTSLRQFPGYAQELMIVWVLPELVQDETHWLRVLQGYVAGCCLLVALTLANFVSSDDPLQIRFVAHGQDPNDAARYMVLALPLAALLAVRRDHWGPRLLARGYIPACILAVLLTASRSGFVVLLVALAGCAAIVIHAYRRIAIPAMLGAPGLVVVGLLLLPRDTFARVASLGEQLHGGDLNQRLNIWAAGWHAFARAPLFGSGAGTFVGVSGLAPEDTAHNTALSLAVEDGAVGLLIFSIVIVLAILCIARAKAATRTALATALIVLLVCSIVATVQENRTTWLLFSLIAAAPGIAAESAVDDCGEVAPSALLPHEEMP